MPPHEIISIFREIALCVSKSIVACPDLPHRLFARDLSCGRGRHPSTFHRHATRFRVGVAVLPITLLCSKRKDSMPATLNFDLDTSAATSDDWARLRLGLLRLGWEKVGSSSWRYPRLDRMHEPEDLMNNVFPIANLFRAICIDRGIPVTNGTIEVHGRSDWRGGISPLGTPILPVEQIYLYQPEVAASSSAKLSEAKLRQLI